MRVADCGGGGGRVAREGGSASPNDHREGPQEEEAEQRRCQRHRVVWDVALGTQLSMYSASTSGGGGSGGYEDPGVHDAAERGRR